MAQNTPARNNKHTPQNILNASFDEDYNILSTGLLGYDTDANVIRRVKVDETGKLETAQTQLESLIDTLQELVQRLSPLAGAMANTAQLRVVATGTVTASGPITSAQSIAEKAVAGISYTQRVAIENNTAIQSNINNAVAA